MVDNSDLTEADQAVLYLLNELNKHFNNVTKILVQKIFFLVNRSLDDRYVQYEPLHYGMYSYDLEEILEKEKDLGLIDNRHKLSYSGQEVSMQINDNRFKKSIDTIIDSIKNLDEDDITYLLYHLYPDFTKNSRIMNNINSYKLESMVINLDKIKIGESKRIETDKNSVLTVKKLDEETIEIM